MTNTDIIKYNGKRYLLNFDTSKFINVDVLNEHQIYKILVKNYSLKSKLPKIDKKYYKMLKNNNKEVLKEQDL